MTAGDTIRYRPIHRVRSGGKARPHKAVVLRVEPQYIVCVDGGKFVTVPYESVVRP